MNIRTWFLFLSLYSLEQQLPNLRVHKNYLGDDIHLRYKGDREEAGQGKMFEFSCPWEV